jgi:hypothetical protein
MEMFEASVDGQLYDPEKWGKFYRPSGVKIEGATGVAADPDEDTPVAKSAPAPQAVATPAPAPAQESVKVTSGDVAEGKPSVDDILKMIRSRQA